MGEKIMVKVTLTFEMDEDKLREIFDDYDVKFTKKKAKELQTDLNLNLFQVEEDMWERFEEIVSEWVDNTLNV
jgi:hypothetical protein